MLIFKMIIISWIVGICTYLGMLKSKTYENRVIELRNLQSSLNMFKTKIEFTYEPIKDIFEEISNIIYKEKENIFFSTAKKLSEKNITLSWYEAIEDTKENFTKEDKEVLKSLGKLLGQTDKTGQIREICLTENLLKMQIEKAEIDKNRNVKLYKTLGIVSGLGISILFM